MKSSFFNSIFTATTTSVDAGMVVLVLAVSLLLGVCLAWVYQFRTLHTKEFLISLTLLPTLITVIIFLVNGNLGTSVAVAGTFSLIRFRSATSGSRELLAVFLSMVIGLSLGMGYLFLGIAAAISLLVIWFVLDNLITISQHQTRRMLTLTISDHQGFETRLERIFSAYCSQSELISVKCISSKNQVKLTYEIDLLPDISDFTLLEKLAEFPDVEAVITREAKKKKNL